MAYGNQTGSGSNGQGGNGKQWAGKPAAAPARAPAAGAFEKDPNEVGIIYQKESEKIGTYYSVSVTADIPAGSKLVIFENKTKNRTEKTPTHVLKLSTAKKS